MTHAEFVVALLFSVLVHIAGHVYCLELSAMIWLDMAAAGCAEQRSQRDIAP